MSDIEALGDTERLTEAVLGQIQGDSARVNELLSALIRHLHEMTTLLNIEMKSLKTEADVSAYVHKATALLHTHSGKPAKK